MSGGLGAGAWTVEPQGMWSLDALPPPSCRQKNKTKCSFYTQGKTRPERVCDLFKVPLQAGTGGWTRTRDSLGQDNWHSALPNKPLGGTRGACINWGGGDGAQHGTADKGQALEPSAYHSSATWKLCGLEPITFPLCASVSSLGITMAPTSQGSYGNQRK